MILGCMSSILKEMPNLYNDLENVAQGGKNDANQIKSQSYVVYLFNIQGIIYLSTTDFLQKNRQ